MTAVYDKLYADSKDGKTFTNLMEIILSEENIKLAYRNIKRNGGSATAGTDGKTISHIEKMPEDEFVSLIQRKLAWYKPKPVKRVEIPKANGKMRPLGIPCILDRIVQQCVLQVLEPICEAKFFYRSNGFRPNRSAENAIAQCYRMINLQNLYYVVDIDIKGFFDNIDHCKLNQQMWKMGIHDKKLLCIISEMLSAPIVMPDKSIETPTKGTPQGGVLSPLLANIVLNELDWWITSQWEEMPTKRQYKEQTNRNGSAIKSSKREALRKTSLKEMYIIRYADDFKIFCRKRSDANKIFIAVEKWLKDRLNLEISKDKSKVVNLKRSYSEFLGFKLKAVRKGNKTVVRSRMLDKAIKRETDKLTGQVKKIQKVGKPERKYLMINRYNSMVIGIQNYYHYATLISLDCRKINRQVETVKTNRLKGDIKKSGCLNEGYIKTHYGKSKQLRFCRTYPIVPIGYVRHKNPMMLKRSVCCYTPEGREEIHKPLGIDMSILHALMRAKSVSRSIEYMDNSISLYAAQCGKCAVTGRKLELEEIHCHHKIPAKNSGVDRYQNLIIIHADVHRLLHATESDIISQYLEQLDLTDAMLKKLNELRKKASLALIIR
jgi:group II intron reverse transcriptase/maturase